MSFQNQPNQQQNQQNQQVQVPQPGPNDLPQNGDNLVHLLREMMAPNTQRVAWASAVFKLFLKDPASVLPMVEQISSCQDPSVRQMASVLLRKRMSPLWRKLDANSKAQIKEVLLKRLADENVRLVRIGVAVLVSAIAKQALPAGEWNELLGYLLQMCSSSENQHREVAMLLFRALAENVGHYLKPHLGTLQSIFVAGLQDPSEKVRVESLKALGVLVEYLDTEEEILRFRAAIPPLISMVKGYLQSGTPHEDDTVSVTVFELFDSLAQSATPIMTEHIQVIVELMMDIALQQQLALNFRDNAVAFVIAIVENKPAKVAKHNLIERMLQVAFSLCTEASKDAIEATDSTIQKVGVDLLDALIAGPAGSAIFAPTLQYSIQLTQSNNEFDRKGGFIILAVMGEGFADELLHYGVDHLLEVIFRGIKDPSEMVVAAACVALTQFGDHMKPDILDHGKDILPYLFMAIEKCPQNLSVIRKSCVAIEVFTEHMGPRVIPFLDELMTRLVALFNQYPKVVQIPVIKAIKSVALASREKFLPYYQACASLMGNIMQQTDDDHLTLRCAATEAIGAIGLAVGKENFKELQPQFTALAIRGTMMDSHGLREAAHLYFKFIATMLDDQVFVMVPTILPLIFGTLASDDGIIRAHAPEENLFSAVGAYDSDDEENKELDQRRALNLTIRTGALDEKLAALASLSTILTVADGRFSAFVKKTMFFLDDITGYPHPYIRQSVMGCFSDVLSFMHRCYPPQQQWTPGVSVPLDNNTQLLANKIFEELIIVAQNDPDKPVVACALETIKDTGMLYGLGLIGCYLEPIIQSVILLLNGESPSQMKANEEEDADFQFDVHDALMGHVTDVISMLAQICGESMPPILDKFLPAIAEMCSPTRPSLDRMVGIGCLADCADNMGPAFAAYATQTLELALLILKSPELQVKRNAAFCIGVIAQHHPALAAPMLNTLLEALATLYVIPDQDEYGNSLSLARRTEYEATRDNAVSALAKIIVTCSNSLPLQPTVEMFVSGLPLCHDYEEAKFVYPCITFLFANHSDVAMPHLPKFVEVMSQVLGDSNIDSDAQAPLIQLSKSLMHQCEAEMKQILAALPDDARNRYLSFIN